MNASQDLSQMKLLLKGSFINQVDEGIPADCQIFEASTWLSSSLLLIGECAKL